MNQPSGVLLLWGLIQKQYEHTVMPLKYKPMLAVRILAFPLPFVVLLNIQEFPILSLVATVVVAYFVSRFYYSIELRETKIIIRTLLRKTSYDPADLIGFFIEGRCPILHHIGLQFTNGRKYIFHIPSNIKDFEHHLTRITSQTPFTGAG